MNPWVAFGLGFLAAYLMAAAVIIAVVFIEARAEGERRARERERQGALGAVICRPPGGLRERIVLHVAGETEAEIAERLLGMLT